jgi:hypothetical protein
MGQLASILDYQDPEYYPRVMGVQTAAALHSSDLSWWAWQGRELA